ncbi:TetR/AcrR family transcriptional regulator [Alphaproteobacteria bacterium]|nr:TetR/AcrR family transcriptional regulator [Alphaproteobacteria bacterium]
MKETDPIKEKILEAARARFGHYGYPKTTIAELADDCSMSAGNIYRFFAGKIDIATEIARRETLEAMRRLEALVNCPYRTARQQLEEIIFTELRITYHLLENRPKVLELAQVVIKERPYFQLDRTRRERRLIARVLQDGIKTGEFQIESVARTAAAIQAATLKYRLGQLITDQPLEDLERELSEVLTMVVRGILTNRELAHFVPTCIPEHIELQEQA